eukprot:4015578-Prymnesium_polylepis.1
MQKSRFRRIVITPPPREAWGASQRQGSTGANSETDASEPSEQPTDRGSCQNAGSIAPWPGLSNLLAWSTLCRIMPLATGREKGHHATGAATRARKRTCAAARSD